MSSAAIKPTHEPSMEDILASIRRIIADDPKSSEPAAFAFDPSRAGPPESSHREADVLDLAELANSPAGTDRDPGPDLADPAPVEQDMAEPPRRPGIAVRHDPGPEASPEVEPRSEDERLVSNGTDAAVSHAFNMLAHTVLSRNAMTLEDLVKDMLRPMLKSWLDENLPPLVERLVRSEIERVARGGR